MISINPKDVSTQHFHSYLLGAVAPRPIAFASTIDQEGRVNLSPFSFFNAFSANPPILIFSPARRIRDNSTKHTLENVLEHREVVINIVNYDMVEQISLASTEYDKGINEFVKSGFTELVSKKVRPPRVAESPASFECKVEEVIHLGKRGGAGNLIICEILLAHFNEDILDENGMIDPHKLDSVARLGGDWYCRTRGDALFELPKPVKKKGIGVDRIPEFIRNSGFFTANEIGRLGNIEAVPTKEELLIFSRTPFLLELKRRYQANPQAFQIALHKHARYYLKNGETEKAWKILLQNSEGSSCRT